VTLNLSVYYSIIIAVVGSVWPLLTDEDLVTIVKVIAKPFKALLRNQIPLFESTLVA
jgi:hypothetical protein